MRFFAPLCLCIFLSSCNANPGPSKELKYENLLSKDTLTYSYKELQEISPYFVAQEDIIDTAKFFIKYPEFEQASFNDLIKQAILIDGDHSVHDAAQSFIDSYNEFAEDSNTSMINAAWYRTTYAQIINMTPLFFSLQTNINEYTGGAHDSHLTFYQNYDIQKAELISLKDLLQKDKFDTFVKLAEKKFRNQENLSASQSLSKDFFFENGKFSINDNFGLSKDKLIIYFNEYEIRPYAEGPTTIEIPYTELKELFNIRGNKIVESIINTAS